jgi:dTDP-4-amino-4,6-dideoxygalactose transaminase
VNSKSKPIHVDRPAILGGTAIQPKGPPDWPFEDPAIEQAVAQAVKNRSWGKYHGPNCERLEHMLREIHSCEHATLCASGTVAVELALRGLGVGTGDEVVLAAYDFKGNFQDVLAVGATPVLIDVVLENWNLDVDQVAAAISPKTKAIIASHLHGGIVQMEELMQIAADHQIAVIEDACQMPCARIQGKPAGTWGDVGILSFGGSKLLSAGRGGAFFSNSKEIVQRARLYSNRGNEAYPLSELQAAVLIPQLEQIDAANRRRHDNVAFLNEQLADRDGLVAFANDSNTGDNYPGYYKLGFRYCAEDFDELSRDSFSRAMRAEGIAFDPGFRALHQIHGKRRYRSAGELPIASRTDECVLVLHHPVLDGARSDLEKISTAVEKIKRFAPEIKTALEGG